MKIQRSQPIQILDRNGGNQWLYHNKWHDRETQKIFFEWSAKKLGHTSMDDWYTVGLKHVYKYGGKRLLDLYDNSLSKALQTVYCEHEWVKWKFTDWKN